MKASLKWIFKNLIYIWRTLCLMMVRHSTNKHTKTTSSWYLFWKKHVDIHVIKGRDSYSSMGMIIIIKYNYAYIDLENCSKITNMHIIKEYELIYARVINTVKCPEKRSRWLWYRFSGFLLIWKAVPYHQCSAIPMIRKYFWNHKYNMLICS